MHGEVLKNEFNIFRRAEIRNILRRYDTEPRWFLLSCLVPEIICLTIVCVKLLCVYLCRYFGCTYRQNLDFNLKKDFKESKLDII